MKIANFLLIIVLLLWFTSLLTAQPDSWVQPYQVEADKNSGHYSSQAKSFLRKEDYRASAANAIICLSMEARKRQIKKAQESLTEALPKAFSESEKRLAHLKQATVNFSGDETANMVYEVVKIYQELIYLNKLYSGLGADQLEGFSIELKDYSQNLKDAEDQLNEVRQQAAVMHYEKGTLYNGSTLREDNLMAARAFNTANLYAPGFRDAKDRYQAAYPLAVCFLGIGEIKNTSGKGNFSLHELRKSVYDLANFYILKDKLNYFRLLSPEDGYSSQANTRFEAEITNIVISRKQEDPSTKDREEEIEENGQKKKVKATVKFFNISAESKAEGHYTITDLQTGKLLESNPFSIGYYWNHSWATYTGDIRALKKSDKKDVEKKDTPHLTDQNLIDSAVHKVGSHFSSAITSFSKAYR